MQFPGKITEDLALFAWLISHQPTVLFSATSNQPAVLFSQNKPAPAISHQPTELIRKDDHMSTIHGKFSIICRQAYLHWSLNSEEGTGIL
jgi:hypothetical protein